MRKCLPRSRRTMARFYSTQAATESGRHDIGHRYRQPYFIVGTLHSCSYMPTSRVRNTGYPAGPHRYRTDVDFACHLVEARSSETFGAGSTGVNPQPQHTRLLRRLQWQLPYHPSATPSMTSHCPRVTKPCYGICPARFHVPTVVSRARACCFTVPIA